MKSKKKKLYLVRHGQTEFNERGLIQGWCDSPLTPLGHQQARAVRNWMDEHQIHPESFYCSTLGRTEQTLKDITDGPYTRLDGLKEFHFGSMEKKPVSSSLPGANATADYYVQFGGESRDQVEKRMMDTLTSIMENDPADTVLACSHGACLYRFASAVDPKKAKALRKFDNCVIYDFDYEDGQFHLNDIINEHVRSLSSSRKSARTEDRAKSSRKTS